MKYSIITSMDPVTVLLSHTLPRSRNEPRKQNTIEMHVSFHPIQWVWGYCGPLSGTAVILPIFLCIPLRELYYQQQSSCYQYRSHFHMYTTSSPLTTISASIQDATYSNIPPTHDNATTMKPITIGLTSIGCRLAPAFFLLEVEVEEPLTVSESDVTVPEDIPPETVVPS